jgi:hypothetical protein
MSLILSGTDGLSDVDGSAATPAIRGTDANTGIFFPAADTIAFAEGGAEVARFDSSGNFGLGTTSPTTPLQIQTAAATGVNSIFCTGSTTAFNFWTISNTSGNARIGVDSSSGGALATGSSAYSTVIGSPNATPLHLISNGTVQATIDTSGNLGIGTTSPADMLDVKGNARVGQGQVVATSTVGAVGIYSGITSGSGNAQLKFFGKSVDNTGLTYELGRISGGSFGAYGIDGGLSFSTALNNGSNVLTLSERMRLDASGNLLVGGTTNTSAAGICCNTTNGISIERSGNGYRQMYMASSVMYFFNGTNQASLSSAGAWTNASDARLKNSIINIKHGLSAVMNTQPRSYKMNDLEGDYIGFVAQELQTVIPEVVSGDPEKQLGVDYGSLVAVAFKAIQEQQTLITQLTARITALESA